MSISSFLYSPPPKKCPGATLWIPYLPRLKRASQVLKIQSALLLPPYFLFITSPALSSKLIVMPQRNLPSKYLKVLGPKGTGDVYTGRAWGTLLSHIWCFFFSFLFRIIIRMAIYATAHKTSFKLCGACLQKSSWLSGGKNGVRPTMFSRSFLIIKVPFSFCYSFPGIIHSAQYIWLCLCHGWWEWLLQLSGSCNKPLQLPVKRRNLPFLINPWIYQVKYAVLLKVFSKRFT